MVYQRVLRQIQLHVLLHHLGHRILYLMSTFTQKIQFQKEVESSSEELRRNPLHESKETEHQNKDG